MRQTTSGNLHELTYHGGSMRSLFHDGEPLRVRACSLSEVEPGDVIVFRSSGEDRNIVHRAIRREGTMLLTRGDDRVAADERPVTHDQFIGRVESVKRGGSWKAVRGGRVGLLRGKMWQGIRSVHLTLLKMSGQHKESQSGTKISNALSDFYKLLAACQRTQLGSNLLPRSETTWTALVALAERHELAPYLCWQLNRAGLLDSIPAESRDRLQRSYRQAWVQYQRLFAAQRRINQAFRERGVDLISLKGLWFAHTLYPDPAARPMTDLDMLVRENDVATALEIFDELGFQRQNGDGGITETKELWLYDAKRKIKVDLHVDLLPYYAEIDWDVNGVWSRAQEADIDGLQLLVLEPEDQLLHLLTHGGVEHLLQPLKVMLDARLAWQKWGPEVEVDAFRSTVDSAGLTQAMGLTLIATNAVFGPMDNAFQPIKESAPATFVRWVTNVGPVINQVSLLRLYAARDYLLYARKQLRRIMVHGRAVTQRSDAGETGSQTTRRIGYLVRRGMTLLGLATGVVITAIRHPERKPLTFLRLVLWLTERR